MVDKSSGGSGILLPKFNQSKIKHPWQRIVTLGLGLLVGSYWLIYGLLTATQNGKLDLANWLPSILPGIGLLFLVMMARRAPLPYGSGLIIIGVFSLVLGMLRQMPMMKLFGLALPVLLVGVLFLYWHAYFKNSELNNLK